MTITVDQVRELRNRTGAGVLDAKNALEAAGGDMEAAALALREKGFAAAAKKATREARQGQVASYIHGSPGRVGVLVEVNCETDFVARTDAFRTLVQNIALQIAATNPTWVNVEGIPAEVLAGPHETEDGQPLAEDTWLEQVVLLRQPTIRDASLTVADLVTQAIAEVGENIVVRRFARFELGEQV